MQRNGDPDRRSVKALIDSEMRRDARKTLQKYGLPLEAEEGGS